MPLFRGLVSVAARFVVPGQERLVSVLDELDIASILAFARKKLKQGALFFIGLDLYAK